MLLGNTTISKSAEHKPTENTFDDTVHKFNNISQTFYDRKMSVESLPDVYTPGMYPGQRDLNPPELKTKLSSDLRSDLENQNRVQNNLQSACLQNKYRSNYYGSRGHALVENNIVYLPSNGELDECYVKSWVRKASLDETNKVKNIKMDPKEYSWRGCMGVECPECSIWTQWSLMVEYPNSPKHLKYLEKYQNCKGDMRIYTNGVEVLDSYHPIRWRCSGKGRQYERLGIDWSCDQEEVR